MRRVLAITLLVAFGSPLVLPLFALTSDPEAALPACCRRHGAHHCGMTMATLRALNGPTIAAPPCASYPSAATLPQVAAASPATSLPPVAGPLRAPAPLAPAPPRAYAFTVSSNLKRGPPVLLA